MAIEGEPGEAAEAFDRLLLWQSVQEAKATQRLVSPEEFTHLLERTEWGTDLSLGLITGTGQDGNGPTQVMFLDPEGHRMGYWCGAETESLAKFNMADVVLFKNNGNRIEQAVVVNLDFELRIKFALGVLAASDQLYQDFFTGVL